MSKEFFQLPSGRLVGPGQPCLIVAEVGNNHQGQYDMAIKMIDQLAEAGADAVKFQKRHTPSLLTREGCAAAYTGPNSFGRTYGEHRDALELSIEEMVALRDYCEQAGVVFFASAWDEVSLDELAGMGMELLKVSSSELVNLPLLRKAGELGLPTIISTGMSTFDEVDLAVETLAAYNLDLAILHCNSSYPCKEEEICLPVMGELAKRYGYPVGYSGHEQGLGPSVASVAMGACIVERHFTLDRTMRGTDHKVSLEPDDFARMVRMIREVEKASSCAVKTVYPTEAKAAQKLRKSVVARRGLAAGHVLTADDLICKSPGTGISPARFDDLLGRTLASDVAEDQQLAWDMLADTGAAQGQVG